MFIDIYIRNELNGQKIELKDTHRVFAQALDVPYEEAKKICYRIAYSIPFISSFSKNVARNVEQRTNMRATNNSSYHNNSQVTNMSK
jgi:hypothetical protein